MKRWSDALERHETVFALAAVAAATVGLLVLALTRQFANFGPETDTLAAFIPEAQRLLAGESLAVEFHPPLYSIFLGLGNLIFGDWIRTGLLISVAAAAITAMTSFLMFRQLGNRAAAWGALVGLVISDWFLQFSATASSEMFFVALFYASCFFVFRALKSEDVKIWVVAGAVIGLGLLSRANGLSLVFLCLAPLLAQPGHRVRGLVAVGLGFLAPLAAWLAFSAATGAPFMPAGNHANLATTYFSGRVSGDDLALMAEKFDSLWAVFAYDPIYLAKTYMGDLFGGLKSVFFDRSLITSPAHLLVLPGLLILFARGKRELALFLVLAIIPQMLIVNFKEFLERYYLFLIPLFGAGIGVSAGFVWQKVPWLSARYLLIGGAVLVGFVGARDALTQAYEKLHATDVELAGAVAAVNAARPACEVLLARKPHVPFYANCPDGFIPAVESPAELHTWLRAQSYGAGVYLYYGSQERRFRPELSSLADASMAPRWLQPVTRSTGPDEWVLYRYEDVQ